MIQSNIQKILGATRHINVRYVWIIILLIIHFQFMISYNKIYGCDNGIYSDDEFRNAITRVNDSTVLNLKEFQILSHPDSTHKYLPQISGYGTADDLMNAVIPAVESSIFTFRKETGFTGTINIYDRSFGRFAILIPDGIKMNNLPKDFNLEKTPSERKQKYEHDVQFVDNHLKYNNYVNGRELQAIDSTNCSEDVIMLVSHFCLMQGMCITCNVNIELRYPDYISNQIIEYYWCYKFEIPEYFFYDSDKSSDFEYWCELHNIELHNNPCIEPWIVTRVSKRITQHNFCTSQ